jgi:hypothetical protein
MAFSPLNGREQAAYDCEFDGMESAIFLKLATLKYFYN